MYSYSGNRSKRYMLTAIYQLNNFDRKIIYDLQELMKEVEAQVREVGARIRGWKIIEDEMEAIFVIKAIDKKSAESAMKILEENLGNFLKKQGMIMNRISVSQVEDEDLSSDEKVDLLMKLQSLRLIIDIMILIKECDPYVHKLLTELSKRPYSQVPDLSTSTDISVNASIMQRLESLGVVEKVERDIIRLSTIGSWLLDLYEDLKEVANKLESFGNETATIYLLLFLLHMYEGDLGLLYEKVFPILDIEQYHDPSLVNSMLEKLENAEIVKRSNRWVEILPKGKALIGELERILSFWEENYVGRLKNPIKELFDTLSSEKKYVVLRDGKLSKFSYEKILESLIRANIDVSIALSVIDSIVNSLRGSAIVGSDEIVWSICRALDSIDGTGEFSTRYQYYVSTQDFLVIKSKNGHMYPFSRTTIEMLVTRNFLSKIPLKASKSMVESLASQIYEGLRSLFMTLVPRVVAIRDETPLCVPEELILEIIRAILSSAVPYFAQLFEASRDENSFRKKVLDICANVMRKSIESFKYALDLLTNGDIRFSIDVFIAEAYKFLSAVLLLLGALPCISFVSLCDVVRHRCSELRKEGDKILLRVPTRSMILRVLKRVDEFARRCLQVFRSRYHGSMYPLARNAKSLENVYRFGINLASQILYILG